MNRMLKDFIKFRIYEKARDGDLLPKLLEEENFE